MSSTCQLSLSRGSRQNIYKLCLARNDWIVAKNVVAVGGLSRWQSDQLESAHEWNCLSLKGKWTFETHHVMLAYLRPQTYRKKCLACAPSYGVVLVKHRDRTLRAKEISGQVFTHKNISSPMSFWWRIMYSGSNFSGTGIFSRSASHTIGIFVGLTSLCPCFELNWSEDSLSSKSQYLTIFSIYVSWSQETEPVICCLLWSQMGAVVIYSDLRFF